MGNGNNQHRAPWTEADVKLLEQAYSTWPPDYSLLPHRGRSALHKQAYERGLTNRRTVGPMFAHVSETDWAYAAGLIEGEGTIAINKAHRKSPNGRAIIVFVNTDMALVDWLQTTFPAASRSEYQGNSLNGSEAKPLSRLCWMRREVVKEMLTHMAPYFRGIRKERAQAMLDFLT